MILTSVLGNQRGEAHIPDRVLRDLAHALLPNITAFFESEEGKAEYAEWVKKQKHRTAALSKLPGKGGAGRR